MYIAEIQSAEASSVWDIKLPDWTEKFDPFTQIAVKSAFVASQILEEKRDVTLVVQDKKGAGNVVTESDIKAEREIIRIILSQFPEHGILAEETKSDGVPQNQYVWIIDPLDGSKNYSKGVPIYSISIALFREGVPVTGVILAPNLRQLFVADEQSAYLNGKPLEVTKTELLGKSLLASGYPYTVTENPLSCMEVENAMIQSEAQVDNLGTSVLHLAYVAAGIFDGKFHAGLRTWDVAAASLMIKHAGGILTDWKGEPLKFLTLEVIDVLASNGKLHAPLLAKIQEAQSD
jgi:myo-inositol-1(or 4)-monophosphatase